ncbi:hypothetical protein G7009_27135 [Pseudomonas capeferrum]|nr:hypothetical protein [Pseudomonas capeferrum]
MSGNSLEQVLARMDRRNVTLGWGAIAAFSRSRLNDLLREQYLQRLSTLRFLPLLNTDVDHDDYIRTRSVLRKLEFGAPLLSFNTASLSDSRAQLTFPIVAGTYLSQSPLAENLLTRFIIDEAMGYTLVMDIDLKLVTGEIDRRGRVTLDLAQATEFRCNLAGQNEKINSLLAGAIKEHFSQLPHHRGRFELGMLDFDGYTPLTPTHFIIRTQAAPGAKTLGADNYGDGAVLTFIQLQANKAPGELPASNFPYLIPDDRNADDSERYTATLVVDKELLKHVTDERVDVLTSLLFPQSHAFVERERHTPHDLAIFGSIEPLPSVLSIDPPFQVVRAGERQQFTLHDQTGKVVTATRWYASSRQSHSAAGDGEIDGNGLYSSVTAQSIGYHSLTIMVTAEYEDQRATARLLVQFEPTQVAPRVAVFTPQTPMDLGAIMRGGETIDWTLLGATRGQLNRNQGTRVTFQPETVASRRQLSVQQVQAKGKEQRQSALVMLNGLQSMVIEPARVKNLEGGQTLQLAERDPALLPEARRRWELIGPGTLDENGVFTAPSGDQQGTSVVTCKLVQNGVVLAAGYSLLEVGEDEPQPESSWTEIASYTVSVPGGDSNATKRQLLNNGFQSLRLQVVIKTQKAPDGKYYRLSADERASIGLNFEISKARVMALGDEDPSEGIEKGDPNLWQTRQLPNRFQLAYGQLAEPANAMHNEEAITRQDIYLHCADRAGLATKFYSSFYVDLGGTESSNKSESENTRIEIIPKDVPDASAFQYSWERVRVEGGVGRPEDPGDPDFDYYLRTIDYWKLKVIGSRFVTCQFLPLTAADDPVSTSMIRWESENSLEIMFSFTGYIFRDALETFDTKIQFDEDLKTLMKGREELDKTVNTMVFETGSLVITNHRVPDFNVIASDNGGPRDRLSRPVAVLLRDHQGNPHYRQIDFRPSDQIGHRNYLEQSLFTPV